MLMTVTVMMTAAAAVTVPVVVAAPTGKVVICEHSDKTLIK